MSLVRFAALIALSAALAAPASAQVPRRPREQQVASLPRFMVANPFVTAGADSAAAVQVGSGLRYRMARMAEGDYNVLTQDQMNDALKQYGYPLNAILSPSLATTLAKSVQARVLVSSTMTKGSSQYALQARLAGVNDEAGSTVTVQQSGQGLGDFGNKVGDALEPAYKSFNEAHKCIDQLASKPNDAANAANKALKQFPGNGLAEYCLAQIALKKNDKKAAVQHFQAAAKNDPQSLAAWSNLAEQFQSQNDTANVLKVFREMLRIAPSNQKLREQAFKYFLQANHPDIAKEIADSGIKNDPYNADFYDLKSNACLFLSDFKCAIDALEAEYQVDSTKADTLFFTKITVAAAQQPDTTRLLKWSRAGVKKFPDNVTLLQSLGKAYTLSNQPDSALVVTQKLLQLNPKDVTPALAAAQGLINAKKPQEAKPLLELVIQNGDAEAKENAAVLLYQAAAPLLQEPAQDFPAAADLLRTATKTANPQGKVYPAANYLLGLATLLQVPKIDPQAEKGKSCELANQEKALLDESAAAFTAGQSANPEVSTRNLGIIKKYQPRVASMQKAYCK